MKALALAAALVAIVGLAGCDEILQAAVKNADEAGQAAARNADEAAAKAEAEAAASAEPEPTTAEELGEMVRDEAIGQGMGAVQAEGEKLGEEKKP